MLTIKWHNKGKQKTVFKLIKVIQIIVISVKFKLNLVPLVLPLVFDKYVYFNRFDNFHQFDNFECFAN